MVIKAVTAFLALPFVVAIALPLALSLLPATRLPHSPVAAMPCFLIGAFILIASVISFYRRGQGTLAPWAPPGSLVVQDLYRHNRNPMYLGIVLILAGWTLATGSVWCLAYLIGVPLAFHLRVVLYEEKEMERLFGAAWEHYRHHVPRWGLRIHPYRSALELRSRADEN